MENKKEARLLKTLSGFTGEAGLYILDPPIKDGRKRHKYVVVSSTVAMFSGPETYIFPADKNGRVKGWGELEGSYRGGLNQRRALEGAGYAIARAESRKV